MIDLDVGAADAYVQTFGRAVEALRLNRHFPDWERVRAHVSAMAGAGLRLDPTSGLPVPREWIRARVEAELKAGRGVETAGSRTESQGRSSGSAREAGALRPSSEGTPTSAAHAPLPARDVQVALRNVHDGRASYAVRVDRLDVVTATLARYSLVLSDRVGRTVSEGELSLRAADSFRTTLELLSTQDAALAFAALREGGLEVEDVVRGVIGPAVLPGRAGPPVPAAGLVLSACLERASVDLTGQRVDDPLVDSLVVFHDARIGLTRARKWAAAHPDVEGVRAWLTSRGSRGLVYGYTP
jgi:hypothetical protein